ncbi:MAG: helix-turn-helix domain-containing protein, partial [Acetobacteraceae bacterium]|nr:helix-turn-helix domain-containing protein [Acetobacteraceae bacterium]
MKRLTRSEPAATAAAEGARLGGELRDARQGLGLSIDDVSAALRIRRVYLVALEEGRARDLPAPAYAIGFVRSYAKALGLDDNEMVRRFREGSGTAAPRKPDLVFPEPVPERGVPAGALVLAGAVVVIGAYVGWWHWSGSGDRVVDAVPPPPPRLEELAALREPPPPEPIPAPPAPGTAGPAGPGAA